MEFEDLTDLFGGYAQQGVGLAVTNWGLIIIGIIFLLTIIIGGVIAIKLLSNVVILFTFKKMNYLKWKRLN